MNNVIPISAARGARAKEPYGLDNAFEAQLVTVLCTRPKFWGTVGPELDPDGFSRPASTLAMKAARAIAHDLGRGPDNGVVVLQRLHRWVNEGKITRADVLAVSELFDEAEDAGLAQEDSLLGEIVPILKRRIEHASIQDALSEYAKRGDPSTALAKMERAKTLGVRTLSGGLDLGDAAFSEMARVRNMQRLKTGILELDVALDGGPFRGSESVFLGAAKSGKSQGLIQVSSAAMLQRCNVGYATLELPKVDIDARITANLTDIAVNDIIADPFGAGGLEGLDLLRTKRGGIGRFRSHWFVPQATTVQDLRAWVTETEEAWQDEMHLLVVDYADKLGSRVLRKQDQGGYKHGEEIYEELRLWTETSKRWLWTASQGTRGKDRKGRKLDLDDVADSMGKSRVADLIVSVNPSPDGDQVTFFIAANRRGKQRQTIGPLPTNFVVARIAPVSIDEFAV